jgi:hypothetical protein
MNRTMTFNPHASPTNKLQRVVPIEFVPFDVLVSERERIQRLAAILQASILGSKAFAEIVIVAESTEGTVRIKTRISAVSEDMVLTPDAGAIPVHCIRMIESS